MTEEKKEDKWVKVDFQPGTPEFDEWLKNIISKKNPIKTKKVST